MATLSQMASSSSPAAYMPKLLGKAAVACILSGALVYLSPEPASPEPPPPQVHLDDLGSKGPGLMRREKTIPKAPSAPKPQEWGQLMRREAPSEVQPGQGSGDVLVVFIVVVVIGFAVQGKGTLSQMAYSSSPSAYFPKFVALVVSAFFLAGIMLHLFPSPLAHQQLMRKETLPASSQNHQSSSFVVLAGFGAMGLAAFASQGRGALAQMASAKSPSTLLLKFFASVVAACFVACMLLHLSPPAASLGPVMRSETSVEVGPPGQTTSSRVFFLALFGIVALTGFAMQAKDQFMQLVSLGGFDRKDKK